MWKKNKKCLSEKMLETLKGVEPAEGRPRGKKYLLRWVEAQPTDKWLSIVPGIKYGRHLRMLFSRIHKQALIIVVERDPKWLKAAFSTTDMRDMIESKRVCILDSHDKKEIHERLCSAAESANREVHVCPQIAYYDVMWWQDTIELIHEYADSVGLGIITQMANSYQTCKNLIENIEDYIFQPGIAIHKDAHQGRAAVLVSAGPSIEKQLELLAKPRNYVLVSCLTMLKPLLQHNIWPDYVTALDYHEIGGRFLEGVPELTKSKVTFIYEPKTNNAVVEATKKIGGDICYLCNGWINELLREVKIERSYLQSGATVAHLSFSLGEYLGCEPLIMVGQDLGFTDGKYYPECVYTAHPWKEPCRARSDPNKFGLRQLEAFGSRKKSKFVWTDHQMACYLETFEQIWANSKKTVIDCTQGGVRKRSVGRCMPFAKAISEYKLGK